MGVLSFDVKSIQRDLRREAEFSHAPLDWSREKAEQVAAEEGLKLTEEHWQVVRALQEFFWRHEEESLPINLRELHDALDEAFHAQDGIRGLYLLFPGGPIAQGCRVAGLKPPFIATDTSFGSVA